MRDELWILGDFSYRLGRDEALSIRQSITCRRIHLVPGNHDRNWAVPELEGAFLLEPPIAKIKYEGHRFVCSHYPIMDWEGMRRGSIQLHGHIHSRPEYNERNQGRGLFRYDVGVDANGYRPVSIEEEIEHARATLAAHGWKVDYVVTHTCANRFLSQTLHPDPNWMNPQTDVLTDFLDELEDKLQFRHWYYGHFHKDRVIDDRHTVVFHKVLRAGEGR